MIDFSSELNQEQLAVVLQGDGPCLVLAGAGSGKTRTITHRVAYLLEQGAKPEEILLVTFTNKAAAEMKRRVQRLTGSDKNLPWSGTFHHIGYRLLKQYAPLLGYKNNFTVLDSDDSEALIKLCVKDVKSDETGKRFPSAAAVASVISFSRNSERPIATVLEEKFEQWYAWEAEILHIAEQYAQRKKAAQAMDFDDLLTNTLLLVRSPQVHTKFATQFKYILVDEYQDTNKIQAAIIKELASVHNNVLVVGDDAQSIYSFRAADIENILGFEKQYSGAKIFKLETNYRSTKPILDVANSVIAYNAEQYKKNLHPLPAAAKATGVALPLLAPQMDQQGEAVFICNKIEALLKEGVPASEIAVLFRAAFHSQALEVELVSRGIEYDYRGGVRFFDRAHVKDVLSYLRVLNNLADTAAWLRILTHEEGIGPAAAERIIAGAQNATDADQIERLGLDLLKGRAQNGWQNFVHIWNALLRSIDRAPSALVLALLKTPYKEYLEAEYIDSRDRLQDLLQLAEFAKRFDTVDEFLATATLQESFRAIGDDQPKLLEDKSRDKIILSTVHQAKGLEWSAVFVINLSAGAFPNERAARDEHGLEEERRLFYVAVTRAKKLLFLTYPMAGGSFGDFLSGPSTFVNEIAPGLLDDHSLLLKNNSVFNAEPQYVDDESANQAPPLKIRPGSLLRDIDDL